MATPIEQQMSGVDNMNYMYSLNATAKGQMRMIVDFDVKTDPNTDLILTQMRETQAASQLPADVTNFGITVQKSVTAPLMLLALYSPNGTYDAQFLGQLRLHQSFGSNYAAVRHRKRAGFRRRAVRHAAVGQARSTGQAGHHRARDRLGHSVAEYGESGRTGGQRAGSEEGREYTYSVRAQGRLITPEEFDQVVVRENPGGAVVRLKDVARVELGAQNYSVLGRLNGKPGAIIAAYQLPGSNAVQAADGLKKLMVDVKTRFPHDIDYVVRWTPPVPSPRA